MERDLAKLQGQQAAVQEASQSNRADADRAVADALLRLSQAEAAQEAAEHACSEAQNEVSPSKMHARAGHGIASTIMICLQIMMHPTSPDLRWIVLATRALHVKTMVKSDSPEGFWKHICSMSGVVLVLHLVSEANRSTARAAGVLRQRCEQDLAIVSLVLPSMHHVPD